VRQLIIVNRLLVIRWISRFTVSVPWEEVKPVGFISFTMSIFLKEFESSTCV
jgi:hypothetical protein